MRKTIYILTLAISFSLQVFSQQKPQADAFTVLTKAIDYGPRITALLKYQTEMAWRQDEKRQDILKSIKSEKELVALQRATKQKVLGMMGGLPQEKTPLQVQNVGAIRMQGFHIEKLVFESLPGFHVTALVYIPDNGTLRHPAVLVACGHSPIGKAHYQALCQRLVQRGYLVICWDPVGQAERSQFWDAAAGKSRYNLVCGEHAVLGNLAYLAGTNLIRWQIWDGIRALDYLLTRSDVDPRRISITGTSGGGLQAAFIAALDERIQTVVPSCYISSLPMRAYNRIFADPDSDPEQDLSGMVAEGVDHAGILLMIYPRPVLIASAVLDFFPIEGTRKTYREIADIYDRFNVGDRIGMVEGYHKHQFSVENQAAAIDFLDRFNNMKPTKSLLAVTELDEKVLRCTKSGQVLLDYPDAKNLTDIIKDHFIMMRNKQTPSISSRYYGNDYPNIKNWMVSEYAEQLPMNSIQCQKTNHYEFDKIQIDHYLLHHSKDLQIPLLYFYSPKNGSGKTVLWLNLSGKANAENWSDISQLVKQGANVISFDFRGTGEDKMNFEATSSDNLKFVNLDTGQIYFNPLSGVFANYVYNALLIGRPYFLQMIEDTEIVCRFALTHLKANEIKVTSTPETKLLVRAIVETLPNINPKTNEDVQGVSWSEIVSEKRELWPIHYLLPDGAFIH